VDALVAFALWVVLGAAFAWLGVPAPELGAAALGWVMAGLVLRWLPDPAVHFGRHCAEAAALLLGIH